MIAAFFWIELHRVILIISVFIFTIIFLSEKHKLEFTKSLIIVQSILLLFFMYDFATGRGLYFFSYSHIVIYVFIFYHCLVIGYQFKKEKNIIKQINVIYYILLVFMIIETVIHLSGNRQLLFSAFPAQGGEAGSIINIYRDYHNRFASSFGINLGALNSIILGNQVASQISVYAMAWFFPLYYGMPRDIKGISRNIWFIIAVLFFMISPTMTANVLFIIGLFLFLFIIPISKINNFKSRIIFFITFIFISGVLIRNLFPLFFGGEIKTFQGTEFTILSYYIYGMIYPIDTFVNLTFFEQLFGIMNPGWAELGFFKIFIANGILWSITMLISIMTITYSALKSSEDIHLKNETSLQEINALKTWIWIAQINAIICLIHLLSLIHYIVIFRLGQLQLFAFHISITMFAIGQVKRLRNSENYVNQTLLT